MTQTTKVALNVQRQRRPWQSKCRECQPIKVKVYNERPGGETLGGVLDILDGGLRANKV